MMTEKNIKQAKILIIDDNPSNLKLLTKILVEQNYRVRIAPSAKLGINSVMAEAPDLILLDIKMPDMDGYNICQQFKANEQTRDIPIIFVSGLEDVMDKVKAFKMGGVDYIVKPFATEEVIARVENQLQIIKKLQENK
ncbi:response regulator [Crocosphaera sp. UHCC 0190]|uniref:response regulator n=1 Tax=Crocosphaera sp. UHCC 0190 TaxID=3110246 RepID=UPI002B1EF6C5|nr:response regulator [Crocosphaera sp. UHCC 0190]MEA5509624.1 response regulator [Crocosphaera sp. UHCC 0190]